MKKIYLLAMLALSVVASATEVFAQEQGEKRDVITFEFGDFLVSVLSEGQQSGRSNVLLNATPEMLKKYLPDGTYPTAVNAFLVRTPDKIVLIDAGFGRKLFDNLQSLDVSAAQVGAVLLTHMHGDHIGGLLRDGKPAFPNAELYLAQAEHDYWTSDKAMQAVPENRRGGFQQAQKVIAAYKGKLRLFAPNELGAATPNLFPGFLGISTPGHTPGHTAYLLESASSRLLIWGDLAHAMSIQMPRPDVAVTYDVNPETAVKSRQTLLEYASKNKIPVGGMHIAYPSIGNVKADSKEGYEFEEICTCLGL
ncbi:MAG: MBL fold metallo-hydrolase [Prevotellaceae bacterium]|jgi:glyoxylase-like metal-dependent hydrolase (beta-lactamase superfamily II)|nr:MBL fold metallo-hydrolase [Prevotellaceae bacterium]